MKYNILSVIYISQRDINGNVYGVNKLINLKNGKQIVVCQEGNLTNTNQAFFEKAKGKVYVERIFKQSKRDIMRDQRESLKRIKELGGFDNALKWFFSNK